jgi:DNA-binding transcriptional LysR family regulator
MNNWNDLKLVLAIARARTLGGGAKLMGVNHSTAFRNLNAIEEKLGARLFERLPGGAYAPTAVGEKVARTAERMETEALALDREITGTDTRLTGLVRVTASETLAFKMLITQLARLREVHPGISVEMLIDNRVLSLSRREADVALRVSRPGEPELFGKKLCNIGWTIYAAPGLVDATSSQDVQSLADQPFIGWYEDVRGISAAEFLTDNLRPKTVVYRSNSLISQYRAACAGMGLAVLPCYLGDGDPALVRVVPDLLSALQRELWIVTHEDLKGTARIRAFLEVVGDGLAKQRETFDGTAPATR